MTQAEMIMSIVSILLCLALVTRGGVIQRLGWQRTIRYASIWAGIIIAVWIVVQWVGSTG